MTETRRRSIRIERLIAGTDAAAIALAVVVAYLSRFNLADSVSVGGEAINQLWVAASLWVLWFAAMRIYRTGQLRILGTGSEEFVSVFEVALRVFGVVSILAFGFKVGISRAFLLIAGPLGLALLWASRYAWRMWLRSWQARGEFLRPLLVIGSCTSAGPLVTRIAKDPHSGFRLVGVCLPGGQLMNGAEWRSMPVLGDVTDALWAARSLRVDAVALTSTDALTPEDKRDLGWALDEYGIEMIVEPALLNVTGPRITTRPVAGLPLLHVDSPTRRGLRNAMKRAYDIMFSLCAIALCALPMAIIALAVKLTSPGPVFFTQTRVGINGQPFRMVKFRTMRVGAEHEVVDLAGRNEGSGPLFKVRDDPRVTRVGRVLRAYSLDELPQFFNVLAGRMSLVGPRPPLPCEVAEYEEAAKRRLIVKPGITGLWQVSGRSDLNWEETVRLDLYYADNWTLLEDVVICMRTVKAVVAGAGAY